MSNQQAKIAASKKALEFIKDGMRVGLGTGSTATQFIHLLIEKCRGGLKIEALATSLVSEALAKEGKIPLLDITQISNLDITIDGTDEFDSRKQLIKGAGGAFVREKIIANMSTEMIVIADETKQVSSLGSCPLPVEVIPFGAFATQKNIEKLALNGSFRKDSDQRPYITDNGNFVFDIVFSVPPKDLAKIHQNLITIPGVIDTGFFSHLASTIIVGKNDGTVTVIT